MFFKAKNTYKKDRDIKKLAHFESIERNLTIDKYASENNNSTTRKSDKINQINITVGTSTISVNQDALNKILSVSRNSGAGDSVLDKVDDIFK